MNARKNVKRLSLNRETIRELQGGEMRAVAGGHDTGTGAAQLSVLGCPSWNITVCDCTGTTGTNGCL